MHARLRTFRRSRASKTVTCALLAITVAQAAADAPDASSGCTESTLKHRRPKATVKHADLVAIKILEERQLARRALLADSGKAGRQATAAQVIAREARGVFQAARTALAAELASTAHPLFLVAMPAIVAAAPRANIRTTWAQRSVRNAARESTVMD